MDKDLQSAWSEYKKQQKSEGGRYIALCFTGVVSFLLIWQLAVMFHLLPVKNLVTPMEVSRTLIDKIHNSKPEGAVLWVHIMSSMQVALSGFVAAIIVGVPLGLLMGWYKPVDKFVRPVFELIRPIPPIAWIPLIILWFGIGLGAKTIIIFFTSFVPCVINCYTGVKLTDKTLVNVSQTFGASTTTTFFRVAVPSAMPMAFAGIRVALGNAWSCLVAAEMLAANAGLGYMITMGRNYSRADIVIAAMAVIGALGALMAGILALFEKHVLRWRVNR